MATWEDGPEYAPLTRPSVFAPPNEAKPLSHAEPARPPAADAPLNRPDFAQRTPARPLAECHPQQGAQRDPNKAFSVASATMTAVDSAWGAVHQHHMPHQNWPAPTGAPVAVPMGPAPTEPITLSRAREEQIGSFQPPAGTAATEAAENLQPAAPGAVNFPPPSSGPINFPPPSGGPVNFPPPTGSPIAQGLSGHGEHPHPASSQGWGAPEQWPTPRNFPDLVLGVQRSLTPAVLWSLVGGCIFLPFSPLLFTVAATASGYVQHRRRWIRNLFIMGAAIIGTVFVVGLFTGGLTQLGSWWDLVSWTSLTVCVVTLAAVVWMASNAVSRGEPPEPREQD